MGSPRKGGNSDLLLDAFLAGVEEKGGEYEKISVCDFSISPCLECLDCETTGVCVIDDGMQAVYPKLTTAEKIVVAAPIYFYGLPAQFKALIDRCQALWARKHLLGRPPVHPSGEAFALLLGATGGKELFRGSLLTLKYFLEPLNIRQTGSLLFRKISRTGDILRHPTAFSDALQSGREFATKAPRH